LASSFAPFVGSPFTSFQVLNVQHEAKFNLNANIKNYLFSRKSKIETVYMLLPLFLLPSLPLITTAAATVATTISLHSS
jgi:hypothetical protein